MIGLSLIPWYWKAGAAAALVTVLACALWGYGTYKYHTGKSDGMASVEKKYNAAYLAEVEKVRVDEAIKRTLVEKSHAEDLVRMAVQKADSADAVAQRDRLLVTLARRSPTGAVPAPGPGLDGPTLIAAVVAACSGRYEEVAGVAGSLTAQVIGLQNYLRSVGLAKQIEGNSPAVGGRPRGALIEVPIQPAAALPSANSSRDGGAPL